MTQTLSRYLYVKRVMGTAGTFDVRGENAAGEAIEAAVAWLQAQLAA
jgi:hypothetical protein